MYATRSFQNNKISSLKIRHIFFFQRFLPAVIITEWNNYDINARSSSSINEVKKELLKFIRPEPSFTYNIMLLKD